MLRYAADWRTIAFLCLFAALATTGWVLSPTGPLLVGWVVVTFFVGKPSKAMVARRLIFKAATGISATPDLLPSHLASEIHRSLQKNPMHDNAAWRFVSSSYQARLENSERARAAAEEAWAQIGGAGGSSSQSPGSLVADDQHR